MSTTLRPTAQAFGPGGSGGWTLTGAASYWQATSDDSASSYGACAGTGSDVWPQDNTLILTFGSNVNRQISTATFRIQCSRSGGAGTWSPTASTDHTLGDGTLVLPAFSGAGNWESFPVTVSSSGLANLPNILLPVAPAPSATITIYELAFVIEYVEGANVGLRAG